MTPAKPHRDEPSAPRLAMTLLELIVAMAVIGLLAGLLLAGVQRVRESAARATCANRLRQIALAAHGYHATEAVLPAGHTSGKGGSPTPSMSWLTRLLPYVEQSAVWSQAEADYRKNRNPFKNPPHAGLDTVVPTYVCPLDGRVQHSAESYGYVVAFTSYLGNEGTDYLARNGVLFSESRVRLADITDGTSSTLLAGERPPSADLFFGWWYAGQGQRETGSGDMILGVREQNGHTGTSTAECAKGPFHFRAGSFDEQCALFHFWSPHAGGGANFAFADGSVRFLSYGSDDIMPALATRAGGETVRVD